jgi:transcriptional regulator with XRE-family HTH domain
MTRTVAEEIRRYRLARRLSAQQLADRCAELGMPIRRSVLANLENGRRDAITIAELLVLAHALDVSPILLVFPVGRRDEVEALPGRSLPTWDAALWLSGTARLQETATGLDVEWAGPDDVIPLYERHEQLVFEWLRRPWEAIWAETEEGEKQAIAQMRDEYIKDLYRVRAVMRDQGLIPPELPDDLAHIDRDSSLKAGPPWKLTRDGHQRPTMTPTPSFDPQSPRRRK